MISRAILKVLLEFTINPFAKKAMEYLFLLCESRAVAPLLKSKSEFRGINLVERCPSIPALKTVKDVTKLFTYSKKIFLSINYSKILDALFRETF